MSHSITQFLTHSERQTPEPVRLPLFNRTAPLDLVTPFYNAHYEHHDIESETRQILPGFALNANYTANLFA
jgi:hypothetical protein